jgi:methanethiol S-methyltransferase
MTPEALINLALIAGFGLQHSLMARQWFKRRFPVARSRLLYVLATFAALFLMAALWQPMPAVVWLWRGWVRWGLWAVFTVGVQLILFGALAINWRELLGFAEPAPPKFQTPFLYTLVRHPIYLGVILALWAAPRMTQGRLLFAAAMTLYIFIGIHFEERDLVRQFGDVYRAYQRRVGMLIPKWRL